MRGLIRGHDRAVVPLALLYSIGVIMFLRRPVPEPRVVEVPEWGLVDPNPDVWQEWLAREATTPVYRIDSPLELQWGVALHPGNVALGARVTSGGKPQLVWVVDLGGAFASYTWGLPAWMSFNASDIRLLEGQVEYTARRDRSEDLFVVLSSGGLLVILLLVLMGDAQVENMFRKYRSR